MHYVILGNEIRQCRARDPNHCRYHTTNDGVALTHYPDIATARAAYEASVSAMAMTMRKKTPVSPVPPPPRQYPGPVPTPPPHDHADDRAVTISVSPVDVRHAARNGERILERWRQVDGSAFTGLTPRGRRIAIEEFADSDRAYAYDPDVYGERTDASERRYELSVIGALRNDPDGSKLKRLDSLSVRVAREHPDEAGETMMIIPPPAPSRSMTSSVYHRLSALLG